MDIPEIPLNNKNIVLILLSIILVALLFIIYGISIPVEEGLTRRSSSKLRNSSPPSATLSLESSNIQKLEDSKTTYSADNLDVTYHDSIDNIIALANAPTLQTYDKTIINQDGESTTITLSETLGNALYFEPGTYKYGLPAYVPSYEDSIFLSKTYNKYATYDNSNNNREVNSQTVILKEMKRKEGIPDQCTSSTTGESCESIMAKLQSNTTIPTPFEANQYYEIE